MYKSPGKFRSESNNFKVIHAQVMTVQLSNLYQAYFILEDEHGKRFKQISNPRNWFAISDYFSQRVKMSIRKDLLIANTETEDTDNEEKITKKENIKSLVTSFVKNPTKAVPVEIKYEVEELYYFNTKLKTISMKEFFISPKTFSFEPPVANINYDLFSFDMDDTDEEEVGEIIASNTELDEDDDGFFAARKKSGDKPDVTFKHTRIGRN